MKSKQLKYVILMAAGIACTECELTSFATMLFSTSPDGGGSRVTSASYLNDASLGILGGISTVGTEISRSD